MPDLVVLVGLPGSGKSTWAKTDITHDVTFTYSTDAYIEECAYLNGWTYDQAFPEFINAATRHANDRLKLALKQHYDVIWDQTNMSLKKRQTILAQVPSSYVK